MDITTSVSYSPFILLRYLPSCIIIFPSRIITINILGGKKRLLTFSFPSLLLQFSAFHLVELCSLPIMLSYHSFLIWLQSCFCFILTPLKLFFTSLPGDHCDINQFSILIFPVFDTVFHSILLKSFFLFFCFLKFNILFFLLVFYFSFLFLVSLHLSTHAPDLSVLTQLLFFD